MEGFALRLLRRCRDADLYRNSGAWKKSSFKKYNFDAEGAPPASGALHPLMKVREEFRNIFFEMGWVYHHEDLQ